MPPETPAPQTTTPDPALAGMPKHGDPMPEAKTTPPASAQTPAGQPSAGATAAGAQIPAKAPAAQKIMLGNREFASVEEMNSYVASIEAKAGLADRMTTALTPQTTQVRDPDEALADELYSDPLKVIKSVRSQAADEAKTALKQEMEAARVRNEFYQKYPDLVGNEDIVGIAYSKFADPKDPRKNLLAQMTEADAGSKLANAARARIAAIKGNQVATEELPNGIPKVVGDGSSAPAGGDAPAPQGTMMDQLAALHARRARKTAAR